MSDKYTEPRTTVTVTDDATTIADLLTIYAVMVYHNYSQDFTLSRACFDFPRALSWLCEMAKSLYDEQTLREVKASDRALLERFMTLC